MSDTTKDGGPAFPFAPPCDQHGALLQGYPFPELGMSLRDVFAKDAPPQPENWRAPATILKAVTRPVFLAGENQEAWAEYHAASKHNTLMHEVSWRWAYADAMIAAREGG